MNKKILLSALFFLGLLFCFKTQTLAQSELQLSVSPPISYLQVPPGTSRSHTVVLENSGDQTVIVEPSIVDFSSDGKSGRAIPSDKLSFPYISFGTSDIKELSIPPYKKAQLTLYIDVPKDAEEKEYPLTILFFSKENSAGNTINSSHSQVSGGIGSNLVVLTSNKTSLGQALKIVSLNTPKIIDSFRGIEFSPLVKNESLASYSASGSAEIKRWGGNTQVEFEIYPDVVLGTNSRELRALRPGIIPDKPETGTFSYKPKFLLGPYQIVITLENEQGDFIKYTEVVYAFPFSVAVIIIMGIIISFIYYKKLDQKFNNFSEEKTQ